MYDPTEYLPYFTVIPRYVGYSFSVPFQLCQADPSRVILFVTAPPSNPVYLYLPGDQMDTNHPRFVVPSGTTARIDWKDWAILVTLELWFINLNNLPNQVMQVTEVRWTPPADQWTGISSSTTADETVIMPSHRQSPPREPYSYSPQTPIVSTSDITARLHRLSGSGSARLLPPAR